MPLVVTHFGSLPIIDHVCPTTPHDVPVPSRRRAIEALDKIDILLTEYELPAQIFDELSIVHSYVLTR